MSKLSDKNFSLDYSLEQLNGCCGIWEMKDFYWQYDAFTDAWLDETSHPSLRRVFAEVKTATKAVLRTGKCVICTITDQHKSDRDLLEAFKHVGWKEHRKVKSNHGRYFIHLLSIQRRKK